MNSKKTNYLVVVLNALLVLIFYVLYCFSDFLFSRISNGISIYNCHTAEFLLNNIEVIIFFMYGGIGTLNIICSIQNKKDRKLSFWQMILGMYLILYLIWEIFTLKLDFESIECVYIVFINSIIPITLAVINLIKIKKNSPKVIQIISYIVVIIIAILNLIVDNNFYIRICWLIIIVIMQFIYVRVQDKDILESNRRKYVNIILYYIIQAIFVVGILALLISSLIITKINDDIMKKEVNKLYNEIITIQGNNITDRYIPVKNNGKYGFINESGEEKVPCEYDMVADFCEVDLNNVKYYITIAKKNNKYYIISKNNSSIVINERLEKYVKNLDISIEKAFSSMLDEKDNYENAIIKCSNFYGLLLVLLTSHNEDVDVQTQTAKGNNKIELEYENFKYYYNTKNYSMVIEKVYDDENYYSSSDPLKYNVTIIKQNEQKESSIVCLPGFEEDSNILRPLSNGFIEFEEEGYSGWYDNNGNKTTIAKPYVVVDVREDTAVLFKDDIEWYDENTIEEYIGIDMKGQIIMQTNYIMGISNGYLIKNKNEKMVLISNKLEVISKEYDVMLPLPIRGADL